MPKDINKNLQAWRYGTISSPLDVKFFNIHLDQHRLRPNTSMLPGSYSVRTRNLPRIYPDVILRVPGTYPVGALYQGLQMSAMSANVSKWLQVASNSPRVGGIPPPILRLLQATNRIRRMSDHDAELQLGNQWVRSTVDLAARESLGDFQLITN